MKLRLKSKKSLPSFHHGFKPGEQIEHSRKKREAKLHKTLERVSTKTRIKQLKEEKITAKREANLAKHPERNDPKVKMTLNIVGTRTGMHMRENPPSSAHMAKIQAMRKIYNKQMPVLACNGCSFQNVCPQFKAGYECAFLPFLNSHKVETEQDLIGYMKELLGAGMRRAHQALIMETLSGAAPSLENTEQLSMLFNQFKEFHELTTEKASLSIETADGGIINRLFGNLDQLIKKTKQAQAEPIDVTPVKMVDAPTIPITSELESLVGGVDNDLIKEHAREEIEPVLSHLKD